MNYQEATKQQLIAIAMDESNRLRDRYAAAKELQDRRKSDEIHRHRSIDQNGICCTG